MCEATAKYTAARRPNGPTPGWAMMKAHVSKYGASSTAIEKKSEA